MAAAALESFPTGSPFDQVLLILLPAGHSVSLSLALLQKVSQCSLDLRPVQIPLADAEEGAPAVLTLYIIAKMFTQLKAGQSLMTGRVSEAPAFQAQLMQPVSSKASPSDCPRGTNGHLLWPKLLAKGFWPHILAELHLFPLQPGECLQELEAGPFLAMACVEAIVSNSDSMKWQGLHSHESPAKKKFLQASIASRWQETSAPPTRRVLRSVNSETDNSLSAFLITSCVIFCYMLSSFISLIFQDGFT